jgi:hypothetical protein
MMSWFRRQRLVAALLILANPALVGSWVAAYHPCPVQDGMQWHSGTAAQVQAEDHAGHEGMVLAEEQPPSHDHSQNDGHCSCIGQCLTAGVALPSFAGDETRLQVTTSQSAVRSTQSAATLPASRPLDLLPPSTAPPIA